LTVILTVSFFCLGGVLFQTPVAWGDAVDISALVSEAMTCTTEGTTVSFGTLTPDSVYTATPVSTTTMSCVSARGCTLYVQDAGAGSGQPGLYKSDAPTHLIPSANATLAAGTEGYGIQAASSTAGTGETLTLAAVYNVSANVVGGLTTTNTAIASSTGPINVREVIVTHKAAISNLTSVGSYSDTITYGCATN
jgi:hypothetical protein